MKQEIPKWLSISPEFYRRLSPETIKQFKKFLKLIHKLEKKKRLESSDGAAPIS